jgi:phage-related protein
MKELIFLGDSREILSQFPDSVKRVIGYDLGLVQEGDEPRDWKPMSSIGIGVREIRVKAISGAYRALYVLKIKDKVHVLHAFQKKTEKTDKHDIELARQRLKLIER